LTQTYPWTDHDTLRGRMQDETPPTGHFIRSPADCAARNSQQPGMTWLGDQVQLTASGATDRPHRIPHGATTPATTADDVVTAQIHQPRDRLPAVQRADTGVRDAELSRASDRHYQLNRRGPVRGDDQRHRRQRFGLLARLVIAARLVGGSARSRAR